MDINQLTPEQRAELKAQIDAADKQAAINRQNTYATLKSELLLKAEEKVRAAIEASKELNDFMDSEGMAFYEIMREYGQLSKTTELPAFSLDNEKFLLSVKANKRKEFDEKADLAAERLIEFLGKWIEGSEKGVKDPMYQLVMMLLERNRKGKLDYQSISKLKAMETKFNSPEYTAIMQLFDESGVINGAAMYYYFWERNPKGVWLKLEPSFNKM